MTSIPAYWCAESLVVTVNGPQGRLTTVIDKPYARVGSHEGSEVLLSGPGIDARSLYLHATSEGVFCVRLQAGNGGTLGSGSWLEANEWLRLGPYGISARLQRETTGPHPRVGLTAWGSASPPLPVCEISIEGKVRDKRRFRARLNLIGRRRELALQMLGQQVSSCHCALFWDSGRLWCIDLLSSNGTLLNGQAIDCALLEIGSSLVIGEFSLKFKRLSRSTPRQSSWRTGDSDEDIEAPSPASSGDNPPADLLAQTISVATSDAGQAEPDAAEPLPAVHLDPQVVPANELIVPSDAERRTEQPQLQEESPGRSLRLLEQRQQLDLQLQQVKEEVAAQVSLLQSESALLAAQRQEMARLRGEFETQRQVLTEDLLALQQQTLQRSSAAEPPKHPPLRDHSPAPQEIVPRPDLDEEALPALEFPAAHEGSEGGQAVTDARRYSPANQPDPGTIIEASYVVEKEANVGRSRPAVGEGQDLAIVNRAESSHEATAGSLSAPRVIGRKALVEPDELGAFVADRLTSPDVAHRWWLRVLWGVAALASLAALIALGYFVLRTP